jgi:predicted TIM-barrel enzyme
MNPDALCISGVTAGVETSLDLLRRVKKVVPDFPVFANTGVNARNVKEQLAVADGAVVGTALKYDGKIWNDVDIKRVKELMGIAKGL